MLVDMSRLGSGIGEDGVIGHRPDLAVRSHQRHRGALHAGAQADHPQFDHGLVSFMTCRITASSGSSARRSGLAWPAAISRATPTSLLIARNCSFSAVT